MPMSIRNPQAEDLAREVAGITGETLTTAVTEALAERLERRRGRRAPLDRRQEIMAVSARCSALPDPDPDPLPGVQR